MLTETKRTDLFCEYYAKWITLMKGDKVVNTSQELSNSLLFLF